MTNPIDLTNLEQATLLFTAVQQLGPLMNLNAVEFQYALLDKLGIAHTEDSFEQGLDDRGIVTTEDENAMMGEAVA